MWYNIYGVRKSLTRHLAQSRKEDFKMEKAIEAVELTEKTGAVLEALKADGGVMFAADIAESNVDLFDKGARSVSPILVTLTRRGFVENAGKADRQVLDKDGNEVTRSYTQYKVTEEGLNLDYSIKA